MDFRGRPPDDNPSTRPHRAWPEPPRLAPVFWLAASKGTVQGPPLFAFWGPRDVGGIAQGYGPCPVAPARTNTRPHRLVTLLASGGALIPPPPGRPRCVRTSPDDTSPRPWPAARR